VWKSAGDIVSHRGKNWVSTVTGDNKGNLPTNRSYWLKTSLAATNGEWDSGATYKSGDYTRRNKHLFGIANLSDILGNHPVHGAESDPYTGTAHQYYAGTDIAFNREHGSFTIAIFDEAIGEYTKSLELNYGNNLNLFDTDYGHDNNSWVSTKAVFDSNFRGMQFRSKDGNTEGGAYIDIHAADCPSAAGELILASTDGGVVRLKQGNVTVFSATKDTTSTWATTTLRPTTDNQVSLGRSVNRFSQVYAGTATINTSDATEKTEVRTLSDKEQAVGLAVNHSHSIIYGSHNQLSDNIFPKLHFFSTVLYTVTGNQHHEKCHAILSGCHTVFRRLFRLRLPGQHTLPVVCFSREIC
jgi:hypothetical protein